MLFKEGLFSRLKFWCSADRIGPDIPTSYWKLYFPSLAYKHCRAKFAHFCKTSSVRPGVYVVACSKIHLGENVVLRPGTMLHADGREGGAGITIEDEVLLGSGVHIYVDKHAFSDPSRPISEQGFEPSKEVVVKRGAWIGANSIILPGVTIGRNAVVGAGSIVSKSIPDFSIAVGNPAKVIRNIEA